MEEQCRQDLVEGREELETTNPEEICHCGSVCEKRLTVEGPSEKDLADAEKRMLSEALDTDMETTTEDAIITLTHRLEEASDTAETLLAQLDDIEGRMGL